MFTIAAAGSAAPSADLAPSKTVVKVIAKTKSKLELCRVIVYPKNKNRVVAKKSAVAVYLPFPFETQSGRRRSSVPNQGLRVTCGLLTVFERARLPPGLRTPKGSTVAPEMVSGACGSCNEAARRKPGNSSGLFRVDPQTNLNIDSTLFRAKQVVLDPR